MLTCIFLQDSLHKTLRVFLHNALHVVLHVVLRQAVHGGEFIHNFLDTRLHRLRRSSDLEVQAETSKGVDGTPPGEVHFGGPVEGLAEGFEQHMRLLLTIILIDLRGPFRSNTLHLRVFHFDFGKKACRLAWLISTLLHLHFHQGLIVFVVILLRLVHLHAFFILELDIDISGLFWFLFRLLCFQNLLVYHFLLQDFLIYHFLIYHFLLYHFLLHHALLLDIFRHLCYAMLLTRSY
mmetsp:Transcript_19/g.52  ORF Transcript_19/g.52 Transcript_19/m.52 type:complete len:236 (+) Transcript_19:1163-1870(+)